MPFQRGSSNPGGMTHRRGRKARARTPNAKSLSWRVPDRLSWLVSVLLAQAELADQREVAAGVRLLQVGQQALARVDHLQQAAATVVVLRVLLEMGGQRVDAGGEQGDLDFRGSGVGGAARVGGNDLCLVEFSHADFL